MAQLDHINMSVNNLKESISWYDKVFQFKQVEEGKSSSGTPYAILRNGESMLCLYEIKNLQQPSSPHNAHRTYHFGLRIKDKEKWENVIQSEQVEIDHTWQYPHSFSWYLLDPSGHEIEVVLWERDEIKFG